MLIQWNTVMLPLAVGWSWAVELRFSTIFNIFMRIKLIIISKFFMINTYNFQNNIFKNLKNHVLDPPKILRFFLAPQCKLPGSSPLFYRGPLSHLQIPIPDIYIWFAFVHSLICFRLLTKYVSQQKEKRDSDKAKNQLDCLDMEHIFQSKSINKSVDSNKSARGQESCTRKHECD